jgi:hypothetical protein
MNTAMKCGLTFLKLEGRPKHRAKRPSIIWLVTLMNANTYGTCAVAGQRLKKNY